MSDSTRTILEVKLKSECAPADGGAPKALRVSAKLWAELCREACNPICVEWPNGPARCGDYFKNPETCPAAKRQVLSVLKYLGHVNWRG